MLTSKPWFDPTLVGEAKILVEVKLHKPFPVKVALEDESGSIAMVDIMYSWLPSKCSTCGHIGHKASYCLGISNSVPAAKTYPNIPTSDPPATQDYAAPIGSITTSADTAIATATDVSAKTCIMESSSAPATPVVGSLFEESVSAGVSVVASVTTSAPPVFVFTSDISSSDKKSETHKPPTTNASNDVLTTAIPESDGAVEGKEIYNMKKMMLCLVKMHFIQPTRLEITV